MTKYNFLARLCFMLTKPKNEMRIPPYITVGNTTGYSPPFNIIHLSKHDATIGDEADGFIAVLNHEIDHWAQFGMLTPKEAVKTLQGYAYEHELFLEIVGLGMIPSERGVPFLERINRFRDVSPTWRKRNL